jgi:hypothetical protein
LTEKVALAVQILKNQNAFKKHEEKLGGRDHNLMGGRQQGAANIKLLPLSRTPHLTFQDLNQHSPKPGTTACSAFLRPGQGVCPSRPTPICIPSHPKASRTQEPEKTHRFNISQEPKRKKREGKGTLP